MTNKHHDDLVPSELNANENNTDQEAAFDAKRLTDAMQEISKLTELLAAAEAKAKEHWDLVLRGRADLENARRRCDRDLQDARRYAIENFATELLMVVDSLEHALIASEGDHASIKSLRHGVELTLKLLLSTLEKFSIKQINPEGQMFDPGIHQAMKTEDSLKVAPNTILSVMQKGYLIHDRVLRPARVIVAKKPENFPEDDE